MYRASGGQFGTIPHVCSFEAVGVHREVISNALFLPRDWDVTTCHWPIFSGNLPEKPELRALWVSVLAIEGQSLVEAVSPRQLSRAWAHFLLGASVGTLRCVLQLTRAFRRVAIDVLIWIPAQGYQHRKCAHDRNPREGESVRGPPEVPG